MLSLSRGSSGKPQVEVIKSVYTLPSPELTCCIEQGSVMMKWGARWSFLWLNNYMLYYGASSACLGISSQTCPPNSLMNYFFKVPAFWKRTDQTWKSWSKGGSKLVSKHGVEERFSWLKSWLHIAYKIPELVLAPASSRKGCNMGNMWMSLFIFWIDGESCDWIYLQ